MLNDLRFALRTFRRSPGFVAIAIASLALGIGANTAIFSLFDQVLLRSLPVADPGRLVLFHSEGQDPGTATADNFETVYSYPMYKEFRDRSQVFDGVIARSGGSATVMEPAGAANAKVDVVSGNFFEVLGVHAAMGRTIVRSDDAAPGANPVVVLSGVYWSGHFGSNPAVLNSRILVNGHPMTVIGVLDRRFLGVQSGQMPDFYVPLAMKQQISPGFDAFADLSFRWLNVIGRIETGVSLEKAQAATRVLFKAVRNENLPRIGKMDPAMLADYNSRTMDLHPAAEGINMLGESWRKPLQVLMAMVGLVLLIACANLANLLIARAAAREREMAVRTAIGASRAAILRQLLTESLTLTLAAGFVGLFLANWAVSGLLWLISEGDDRSWLSAGLDFRLFAYTLAVSALAGLVFGCAPLLQTWKLDLVTALKEQAGTTASSSRQRLRKVLVAAQVALALVLLAGAALFAQTLANLKHTNPGFEAANVLRFAIEPRLNGYDKERAMALLRTVRERLAALPGVETVAYAGLGPFADGNMGTGVYVEGRLTSFNDEASTDSLSGAFFHALRIPIVSGREFDERDNAAGPKVAIINQAFAKKYFPGRNLLGLHVGGSRSHVDYEVVGMAHDMAHGSLREAAKPFLYFPFERHPLDRTVFYVRGYGPQLGPAVRAALRQIDANLPVMGMAAMQSRVDESVSIERSIATLAAGFGLLATLLAAVGLYGVVAYSVARRTVEIGVRMALGAERTDIYRIVLKEVGILLLAGTAAGLPAALALGKLVESQLYGVKPHDPLLIAATVAALAAVALAAAFIPARRAASIDPVRALRGE
ncbi:MAG: ABC transporter permease [Bryobacteraceae bacterium]|jgi:predicted permease